MIKYFDENDSVLLTSCSNVRISSDSFDEDGKKWYIPIKAVNNMAQYPMFTNEILLSFDSPYEVYAALEQFDEDSNIWRAHLIAARPENYEPGRILLNPEEVEFENYAVFGNEAIKIEIDDKVIEVSTGGLGEAVADVNSMDAVKKEVLEEKLDIGNIICTCAMLKKDEGKSLEFFDMIIAFSGKLGYMKDRIPEILEALTGRVPVKRNLKTEDEKMKDAL